LPKRSKKKPLTDSYNLLACHPDVAEQWDYEANAPHRPEDFTPGSGKRFQWICTKNSDHRWIAAITTRVMGHGCGVCAGKIPSKDNSIAGKYPDLVSEWHPIKNGSLTPDQVLCGSRKKRHWQCGLGHEWEATPLNRTSGGSGCPTCALSSTSRIEIRVFSELFTLLSQHTSVEWRQKIDGIECDIVMSDFRLGVEVDGFYWHDGKEDKDKAKRRALKRSGLRLIRLRDNRLTALGHEDDVPFSAASGDDEVLHNLALRLADICRDNGELEASKMLRSYAGGNLVGDDLYAEMVKTMGRPPKERSFADISPDAALDWDYVKNGALDPKDFYPHSHYPAYWKCKDCSHEWRVTIGSRTAGNGCPNCSSRVATKDHNLLKDDPSVLSAWDFDRNDHPPQAYTPRSSQVVHWKCDKGHRWTAQIQSWRISSRCPVCHLADNSLAAKCPEVAAQWHEDKNTNLTPDQVNYGSKRLVWWQCAMGHEWQAKINARTSGNGCPICAGKSVIYETSLAHLRPDLAKQWVASDPPGLSPEDVRPGSNKKATWRCHRGHEWCASINSRSRGTGCPHCQDPFADINCEDLPRTRAEAQKIGSKYYFTGRPCRRSGHIAPRHVGNKNCRDCTLERGNAAYARKRAKHPS
jgi:DNA-directed RNA polymerase subunit RPC12/RpoP